MKLSRERIRILARDIVKGLAERQFIAIALPESELAEKIGEILLKEKVIEEQLENEAREMLKAHAQEIQKGDIDVHKAFLMIKKKLAKDRGIIL